jgi:hypothetical protein
MDEGVRGVRHSLKLRGWRAPRLPRIAIADRPERAR